jgi:hypothetical protein
LNKTAVILFFIILIAGIVSCSKDPSPAPDLGYNYFPDQPGRYVVYNVDSVFYDDFYIPAKKDSFKFQIREKIESIFTDNQGRPAMRLERYVKYYDPAIPYSAMAWTLRDVWTQTKTLKTAEKVEENVRFIKLAFPVNEDQLWNGNAQNTLEAENYRYNFFDRARTLGGIHFDSVLQVDQYDELDLIHKKYSQEKYARNAGLVYRQVIDVESQYPPAWNALPTAILNDSLNTFFAKPIMNRVSSGFQFTMTVTTYGTE